MQEYQDKVARIVSGTPDGGSQVLSGTVTRTSKTSIWVKFPGLDEMRFVRSQDGKFRRYGRSTEQASPHLVFPAEVVTPEERQAALDAEAAADGFHGPVILTGKSRMAGDERWYEIRWEYDPTFPDSGTEAWVSWDAPIDRWAPAPETPTALTGWVDDPDTGWFGPAYQHPSRK